MLTSGVCRSPMCLVSKLLGTYGAVVKDRDAKKKLKI